MKRHVPMRPPVAVGLSLVAVVGMAAAIVTAFDDNPTDDFEADNLAWIMGSLAIAIPAIALISTRVPGVSGRVLYASALVLAVAVAALVLLYVWPA